MSKQNGLPTGWVRTSIGKIAKTQTGGTPSRGRSDFFTGTIPWVKSGELGDRVVFDTEEKITEEALESSNAKKFPKGTLCIALYGATIGKLGILGIEATTNQAICGIFLPEGIDTRYVYRFLEWKRPDLIRLGQGGAQPNISNSIVQQTDLLLPPFNEQRRIVAKIEELFSDLDAGIAALERIKANLKRYRAAVLKAAVEGKLTEEWRVQHPKVEPATKLLERILAERRKKWEEDQLAKFATTKKTLPKGWREKYVEPSAPDANGLPELPQGWCWASPEQLAATDDYALAIGPFGSNLKVSDYTDHGIPLVFVRNIRSATFEGSSTKYISEAKAAELKAHQIQSGDVLITKMGDPPGDACLYPEGRPTAVITADCIKFRPANLVGVPKLFVFAINSEVVHQQIVGITKGVAQQKVSLARFSTIALPLPPSAEQEQIVAEVERLFSIISVSDSQIHANRVRAARLRQSILKRAFEGKLMAQDPTDEPAEKLLDRIRQERTEANGSVVPPTRRGHDRTTRKRAKARSKL